jgi:hypothetical protein
VKIDVLLYASYEVKNLPDVLSIMRIITSKLDIDVHTSAETSFG